jgi:hypothetical protein
MPTGFALGLPLTPGVGLAVAVGPHAATTPTAAKACKNRRRFITPSSVI